MMMFLCNIGFHDWTRWNTKTIRKRFYDTTTGKSLSERNVDGQIRECKRCNIKQLREIGQVS